MNERPAGSICARGFALITAPNIFTARRTIVQSAVLRLHVVCPSVWLSVTLVAQDHISWKLNLGN